MHFHLKKHRCFSARLPPDEDPAVESGRVMRPVEVGEEVLARWSDEGWYYRGNTNIGRILYRICSFLDMHVCVFLGRATFAYEEQ